MQGKSGLHTVGYVLVVVGALNWGLVGLSMLLGGGNWNLVNLLFGSVSWLEAVVYVLVGLSGVLMLAGCKSCCKK